MHCLIYDLNSASFESSFAKDAEDSLTILDKYWEGRPERGRADQRLNHNLSGADLDLHKSHSDL